THGFLPSSDHLSALASTLGGIGNPICLAAFRLIKNSNFVGCSTGKSPAWLLSEFCPRGSRRADNSQAHSVHRTSGHQRLHTCLRCRLQATVSWHGFNCTRFHLWSFLGVGPQRHFHQTLVRLTTRRSGDIAPV